MGKRKKLSAVSVGMSKSAASVPEHEVPQKSEASSQFEESSSRSGRSGRSRGVGVDATGEWFALLGRAALIVDTTKKKKGANGEENLASSPSSEPRGRETASASLASSGPRRSPTSYRGQWNEVVTKVGSPTQSPISKKRNSQVDNMSVSSLELAPGSSRGSKNTSPGLLPLPRSAPASLRSSRSRRDLDSHSGSTSVESSRSPNLPPPLDIDGMSQRSALPSKRKAAGSLRGGVRVSHAEIERHLMSSRAKRRRFHPPPLPPDAAAAASSPRRRRHVPPSPSMTPSPHSTSASSSSSRWRHRRSLPPMSPLPPRRTMTPSPSPSISSRRELSTREIDSDLHAICSSPGFPRRLLDDAAEMRKRRRRHHRDVSASSRRSSASSAQTTPVMPSASSTTASPYSSSALHERRRQPTPFALPASAAAASPRTHRRRHHRESGAAHFEGTLVSGSPPERHAKFRNSRSSRRYSERKRKRERALLSDDTSEDAHEGAQETEESDESSSEGEKYVGRDRKRRRRRMLRMASRRTRAEEENEEEDGNEEEVEEESPMESGTAYHRKQKRKVQQFAKSKATDLSYSPHAHSPLLYSHDDPTYLQMASFIPRHQLHQRPRLPKHLRRKRRGGGSAAGGITSGSSVLEHTEGRSISPSTIDGSERTHIDARSSHMHHHIPPYGYPSSGRLAHRSYNIMPRSMIDPAESLARTRSRRKRKPAKKVVEELELKELERKVANGEISLKPSKTSSSSLAVVQPAAAASSAVSSSRTPIAMAKTVRMTAKAPSPSSSSVSSQPSSSSSSSSRLKGVSHNGGHFGVGASGSNKARLYTNPVPRKLLEPHLRNFPDKAIRIRMGVIHHLGNQMVTGDIVMCTRNGGPPFECTLTSVSSTELHIRQHATGEYTRIWVVHLRGGKWSLTPKFPNHSGMVAARFPPRPRPLLLALLAGANESEDDEGEGGEGEDAGGGNGNVDESAVKGSLIQKNVISPGAHSSSSIPLPAPSIAAVLPLPAVVSTGGVLSSIPPAPSKSAPKLPPPLPPPPHVAGANPSIPPAPPRSLPPPPSPKSLPPSGGGVTSYRSAVSSRNCVSPAPMSSHAHSQVSQMFPIPSSVQHGGMPLLALPALPVHSAHHSLHHFKSSAKPTTADVNSMFIPAKKSVPADASNAAGTSSSSSRRSSNTVSSSPPPAPPFRVPGADSAGSSFAHAPNFPTRHSSLYAGSLFSHNSSSLPTMPSHAPAPLPPPPAPTVTIPLAPPAPTSVAAPFSLPPPLTLLPTRVLT